LYSSTEPEVARELLFSLQLALQFPLWVVGTTMDITERKQSVDAIERLRKLEAELAEKLRNVIETMPTMVWIAGTDGSNEFANHHWQEYTGLSHERSVGSAWQDVVHPADLKRHLEKWCASRATGEPFENEVRYRRAADGQYRWFLSRAVPLRDGKGEIVKWYGVSTDIEERKRAEERLRESEAYLAEAQRLSQTGSWAWSPATGDIRYWSETCYRVLGFDPAGPLPRFEEFFHRIHPDDQAALRERFDKATRDKADFELDYRVVHPEKGIRDIHAVGHAVLDGSGNLGEFVGTVIDVTERKRAEQELRQSEADLRTKNDRLKLLLNVTNQITSNLELREVLRAVSSNIREVMQCDAVFVSLVGSASGTPRLYLLDFPQSKGFIKEEMVYTISGAGKRVLETLKPLVVDLSDPAAVPPEIYDKVVAEGLKSACLIPLVNRGRVLGGLVIARATETSFAPEDVEFLSQASGQVAIAIENALAFQEVSGLRDRLQLLLNLTNRITSSLDLREVLRTVASSIRELIHADAVAVSQPDATSGKFRLIAVDFPHGKGAIKEELLYAPGAAGRKAADTLKPVVGYAPELDERESSEVRDIAAVEGMKAYCLIPLVNYGRFLGILSILRTTETPFAPEDVDLLSQASGQIAIAIENALAYKEISQLKDKLAQEKLYLEEEIRSDSGFERIIGKGAALKHVLKLVETVAPSDSTILLLGETGTGKELIARAIHERSRRQNRTFVKLNCAAIPTGLLESELFGHEKGAFTGAITQKIGRLELADQGTLFLDEVGDIPTEIQPKLLRALQEREFERLGSTHTRKVNVRLVAATNRNLEKMVADREFRSDLFYRLNVFPIRIPPLRERKEDIPLLVSYFAQKFAKQMQKQIESVPSAVMKGLTGWEWPGNIRELENFIERAVILTRGKALEVPLTELQKIGTEAATETVVSKTKRTARGASNSRPDISAGAEEYQRKQREEIIQALTTCKGCIGGADGAASRLGINRTTLMYRMRKLGIYAKLYS
jgi:formate hydrogenlyase transcriptional activator